MRSFKTFLTLIFFCCGAVLCSVSGAEPEKKIDPKTMAVADFLKITRRPPASEVWAKLSGEIQHRRKGFGTLKAPLRLGIRFMRGRVQGELAIDGKEEVYLVSQTYDIPPASTVLYKGRALEQDQAKLRKIGLSPQDLLMGFIYTDFVREEAQTRVSIFHCRTLVMKSTDAGEFTRMYVSTDYCFPIKVEWFRADPAAGAKPYRTMEIASIKEIKDKNLVFPAELSIFGGDWRTKVKFTDHDAAESSGTIPKDLFISM